VLARVEKMQASERQPRVGILTSERRQVWAEVREKLSEVNEENRRALEQIEGAIFLLILEGASPSGSDSPGLGGSPSQQMTLQARLALMGDGGNRWFDKSVQAIVFNDGVAATNVEGSWADAPVAAHLFGFMHDYEDLVASREVERSAALRTPSRDGGPSSLPPPLHLKWRLTSEVAQALDVAEDRFAALVVATDLSVTHFRYFGKGFIKKCQISPDAFVQMALLLAYYREHQRLGLCKEGAHTRQFFHGRSENLWTVTSDAVAFVKAMAHLDVSCAETKLHLLRRACMSHVQRVKEAMSGLGIDRHLLALRQVARERGETHAALEAWADSPGTPLLLESSQAPAQRGPSGGFGSAQAGGFAVSYSIREDNMYLHICHRRPHSSEPEPAARGGGRGGPGGATGEVVEGAAGKLARGIEKALLEMSVLCTKRAATAMVNSLSTLEISDT